jgi:hypothetical protein
LQHNLGYSGPDLLGLSSSHFDPITDQWDATVLRNLERKAEEIALNLRIATSTYV